MPRKLSFRVCARSGWEDGYSGTDISTHTPLMKGWRSQRFCTYPQQLVIQLGGEFHISQLQLLSHQYLITSRVELFVGTRRLGHVSMSNNEKSSFRQRELKSIHLDVSCSEMKLLLHHNHVNQLNLFNQVALVAMNVIGDCLDHRQNNEPYDYIHIRPEQTSRFTDLAFAINQDPSIASLILQLEQNKRTAVQKEKYKLAKQLKECIGELQQVGEELATYEVQKRDAIQKEDYNLAEEKRLQGEMCRQQAFKRLDLSTLLTESDALEEQSSSLQLLHPVKLQDTVVELQPIKTEDDSKTPHDTPNQDYHHDNQDDRPLPTLIKSGSRVATHPRAAATPTLHGPDSLSKKATQEATPIIKVFGVYTAQLLYSKHFQHRSEGIDNIITEISTCTSSTTLLLKALTLTLQKLLKDKVFQVFNRCTELLLELCSSLAEKLKLGKHELSNLIEKIGHVLLHRLGDNTPRIRQTAIKILQQLTELPLIKKWNLTDWLLLELPTTQSPWRQVLGQIEILNDICCNVDSKIDVPSTIEFLTHCMEHIQQPVRTAAFDGLIQLYSHYGNVVRQKLSTFEEKKSSIVWRKLFESFDRIDGKPSAADIAAAKILQEKENQEELHKLREQHKKLKAIARSHDQNTGSHDHSHNVCLFCGTEQTIPMEEHYLNCAMLTYCIHCKQMVEISGLTDHLLGECEVHEQYHKCRRCGEAVHTSNYDNHDSCPLLEDNKQCCPFCHSQITANESSWKDHLMGANSCRKRVATSSLEIQQLRTLTVRT